MQCKSFEFIFVGIYSIQRGYVQVVVLYKYPKSSQTDFIELLNLIELLIELLNKLKLLKHLNLHLDIWTTF